MSQAQSSPDRYEPGLFIPGPVVPGRTAVLTGNERKLPYRLAMPLIAGLSLGLWFLIWRVFAVAGRFLFS
jgi:hypothetical protein